MRLYYCATSKYHVAVTCHLMTTKLTPKEIVTLKSGMNQASLRLSQLRIIILISP